MIRSLPLAVLTPYSLELISTTSVFSRPRLSASRPSVEIAKLKIWFESKFVICFGSPPFNGINHRFEIELSFLI